MKTLFELGNWFIRYLVDPPLRLLTQPPSAEDHSQAQKDGQAGPGDAVQGRFGAAGTAEHRASAGSQRQLNVQQRQQRRSHPEPRHLDLPGHLSEPGGDPQRRVAWLKI